MTNGISVGQNLSAGTPGSVDIISDSGSNRKWWLAGRVGRLDFVTNSVSSYNPSTGAMTLGVDTTLASLLSNGNFGINTTLPADKLHVAGDMRVGTGTTGCVKDADATVIAGTCSSDLRLKKDIKPFSDVLDKLVQLQPVHFYWKTKEYPEKGFGSSRSFGLVAQEVEKIFPELVTQDREGYKAIRYNELPFLMLQAIKELEDENKMIGAENRKMKEELADLKSQIAEVKQLFIQKTSFVNK